MSTVALSLLFSFDDLKQKVANEEKEGEKVRERKRQERFLAKPLTAPLLVSFLYPMLSLSLFLYADLIFRDNLCLFYPLANSMYICDYTKACTPVPPAVYGSA